MLPIERGVSRQMLHAWKLGFCHPWSGQRMDFMAPLADDMKDHLCAHELWDDNKIGCF